MAYSSMAKQVSGEVLLAGHRSAEQPYPIRLSLPIPTADWLSMPLGLIMHYLQMVKPWLITLVLGVDLFRSAVLLTLPLPRAMMMLKKLPRKLLRPKPLK